MIPEIKAFCDSLVKEFDSIPAERKALLKKISEYVNVKRQQHNSADLVYICTHNSRRSHFGQVWAKVGSYYYGISGVNTYSGGTEATAFNSNAINALRHIGFQVKSEHADKNPLHHVAYDERQPPIECFSKVYNDPQNPRSEFVAIMTCDDAEENCPFIPGAELRIATTYEDPKAFDNTPQQDKKYSERCRQIALETLYVFSNVK
jgi:arsenate reductase